MIADELLDRVTDQLLLPEKDRVPFRPFVDKKEYVAGYAISSRDRDIPEGLKFIIPILVPVDKEQRAAMGDGVIMDQISESQWSEIKHRSGAPRSVNYWFADIDTEHGNGSKWQPVLQVGAIMCLPFEVWFETEAACEQFIRDEILGVNELR